MRCSSKKRLIDTFKISAADAVLFRRIADAVDQKQETFENVIDSDKRFATIAHNNEHNFDKVSGRIQIAMECFAILLSMHGVEHVVHNNITIGSYVNGGDSYDATICHHRLTNNFYISCHATAFPR